MFKCCFKNQCSGRVTSSCKCTDPKGYFCDKHFSKHSRVTPGRHESENLILQFSKDQTREFIPKLRQIREALQGQKKDIMTITAKLISFIEEEATNSLKRIKELKKTIKNLLLEKKINTQAYNMTLQNEITSHITTTEQTDQMREIIRSFFRPYHSKGSVENKGNTRDSIMEDCIIGDTVMKLPTIGDLNWKDCNEVIFSSNRASGGLLSIDLDLLTISKLEYTPRIMPYCQICKIDKYIYFIHGGSIENKSCRLPYAYFVNIKEQSYRFLRDGPPKSSGASVLKDNKVYVFGGYNKNNFLATCDTFNLLTKEWKSIHPLPQECNSMTAAILNKDIALSGYQIDCCYSYNDSVYSRILKLPSACYKILCEGWILAKSMLYENLQDDNLLWINHKINTIWDESLWTYTVFKKQYYFYFIDTNNSLMRLDIKKKVLERIDYIN